MLAESFVCHLLDIKSVVEAQSFNVFKIFNFLFADLQTIEERVTERKYTKLSEFVGDVMRIFENCRFFKQPNSQITKSAVALESFFSQKLALLREKIAEP